MSNNLYTFLAIISAGVGMVICRILPYIIFANGKLPKIVKFYEKYLPFSLMAILFCLCLSTVKFSIYPLFLIVISEDTPTIYLLFIFSLLKLKI